MYLFIFLNKLKKLFFFPMTKRRKKSKVEKFWSLKQTLILSNSNIL